MTGDKFEYWYFKQKCFLPWIQNSEFSIAFVSCLPWWYIYIYIYIYREREREEAGLGGITFNKTVPPCTGHLQLCWSSQAEVRGQKTPRTEHKHMKPVPKQSEIWVDKLCSTLEITGPLFGC
jgi:hypothetical protein